MMSCILFYVLDYLGTFPLGILEESLGHSGLMGISALSCRGGDRGDYMSLDVLAVGFLLLVKSQEGIPYFIL